MRGTVDGLASPHPLGLRLPGLFLDDDFAQRWCDALDEVLAPVFTTLDCLPAYLDPGLAPADYVDWLATWLALELEDRWPTGRRRAIVARGIELHRWRGTRRGLVDHVRLATGGEVEVHDSGGCTWSAETGSRVPGAPAAVHVRVTVADPAAVDVDRLRALVVDAAPAHVTCTVEIRGGGGAHL